MSSFKKKDGPKILVYDIETSPIVGYVWSLWDQNVGLNQIVSDWHVLSWSAKWLGEDNVMYADQRNEKNIEDDKKILKKLWNLLDKADIVITQNGKNFDQKKINARFIFHGFQPPSSYRHIDTKQIASKVFGFTSNKLEYMTDILCSKYKKLKHKKYEGFELWKECLAGNVEAWNEMEKYNKHDVLSLEELYLKMAPWGDPINRNVYTDDSKHVCDCGSTHFHAHGYDYSSVAKYKRWRCTKCGREYRDKLNLLPHEKKKAMKRNLLRRT